MPEESGLLILNTPAIKSQSALEWSRASRPLGCVPEFASSMAPIAERRERFVERSWFMPGSRVVAAPVRLSQGLNQQRVALAAAARCQDGIDVAHGKAAEWPHKARGW